VKKERIDRKKILFAIIALAVIAIIASPTVAGVWGTSPVEGLENNVIKAGSPFAFQLYKDSECSLSYNRILMFVKDKDSITEVPVYGYFYQNREKTQVVYSIWVPRDVPSGEYVLDISVQGRTWITIEIQGNQWIEGNFGPWTQLYRLKYNVVVLEADEYEYGMASINCADVSGLSETYGVEENLDAGQRATLQATLADEIAQRGL